MNRLIYYKNLMLFLLFVVVLFATPFVFAETSSPTLVRVDQARVKFLNENNPKKINTMLGSGSIIRFPNLIAENIVYDGNNNINMYETLRVWNSLAADDERLQPQYVDGQLYYPVKILKASNNKYNLKDSGNLGWVPLAEFFKPHSFQTVRAEQNYLQQQEDPEVIPEDTNTEPISPINTPSEDESISMPFFESVSSEDSGFSETTTPVSYAPRTSLRPLQRPLQNKTETTSPETSTPTKQKSMVIFNCNNTVYRSSNFSKYSCLKSMSLADRAKLVMQDVIQINKMRPEFNLDPRMSTCMAYRESGFNPNAKGGTPDWGMYQVIDSTGRHVLRVTPSVIPGFKGLSWTQYRNKMLSSTLAQADLHHNVVYQKAKVSSSDLRSMNAAMNGSAKQVSSSVVQRIATRYNGAGSRAIRYGNAIRNCYSCMTQISSKTGSISNSGRLSYCLNKAKH